MQVGMGKQVLTPTMEQGEEADLGAEVLGIGGNGLKGFGGGPEQNAIDYFFVLIGDRGNLFRQRKDHVEILGVVKVGAALFQPFGAGQRLAFWTMPIGLRVARGTLIPPLVDALRIPPANTTATCLTRPPPS